MIYQTTKNLHPDLKSWGCYFLTAIRIYEKTAELSLSVKNINDIYKLSVRTGYVGNEVWMKEGALNGICQIASGITGVHVYMRIVSSQSNYNNIIAKYSRMLPSGEYNSHFCLMKSAKVMDYDPWSDRGSKTVREGKIVDYRYVWSEVV